MTDCHRPKEIWYLTDFMPVWEAIIRWCFQKGKSTQPLPAECFRFFLTLYYRTVTSHIQWDKVTPSHKPKYFLTFFSTSCIGKVANLRKGELAMLKILTWLLLDSFFLYGLISFYDEMGGYIVLCVAAIAFFTWELIRSIKQLFE